jgi:hypothetical protein
LKTTVYILIGLLLFLFSCKKDTEVTPTTKGYSYAGLTVGKYVIYDVDSIFYDDFDNSTNQYYFQIKELIQSKYIDAEGEEAYRIERYKKDTAVSPNFELQVVWNSKITPTTYQKVENNERFVKLIFPVKQGETWNGNSLNNRSTWEYECVSAHIPEQIGGIGLDSVATITQFDDGDEILIQRQFYQEKFAAKIGLVYKKVIDVKKAFNNQTGFYENSLGVDVTYTLNSYGMN